MKNSSQKSKKMSFLKINSGNEFLDGIDAAINLSLVPFLAFFHFENLDSRIAIITTLAILSLSFFIRPFVPFFLLKFKNEIALYRKNLFLIILPLFYFLPVLTPNIEGLIYVNIFFLIISRIAFGFIISLNNNFLCEYFDNSFTSFSNIKYWLSFLLGIFVGISCSILINQIFSNSELNNWAWKLGYIFLILFSLIFVFIQKVYGSDVNHKKITKDEFYINYNLKSLTVYFFRNILILIPIIYILCFCFNSWLPGTVSPENMFFSEIKLVHILFLFLTSIFSNFIFELIGREKVNTYFCSFMLVISFVLFFLVEHKTTYSINFLHFFIAFVSSISLTLFYFDIRKLFPKKDFLTFYLCQNLPFFFISLIIPFFVYYLMFNIVDYNLIYLIIFFIFLMSVISKRIINNKKLN